MAAVIKAPITNFLSLADIDAAANQARAAEQQYQLRGLQMKDALRKQQQAEELRSLTRQAYVPGTKGSPSEPFQTTEEQEFGLPALGGNIAREAVAATPGGLDRGKLADLYAQKGYIEEADAVSERGQKLESGQAKTTSEQTKVLLEHIMNPAAWGKGGILHKNAPEQLKYLFAGEYNEEAATKMHQAGMSAKDKETKRHNLATEDINRTKASKEAKQSQIAERVAGIKALGLPPEQEQEELRKVYLGIKGAGAVSVEKSRREAESIDLAIASAKELFEKIKNDKYLVGIPGRVRRGVATVAGSIVPEFEADSKKAKVDFERLLSTIRQSLPTKFTDTHKELERIQQIIGSDNFAVADSTLYALSSLVEDLEKKRAVAVGGKPTAGGANQAPSANRPAWDSFFSNPQ